MNVCVCVCVCGCVGVCVCACVRLYALFHCLAVYQHEFTVRIHMSVFVHIQYANVFHVEFFYSLVCG